MSNRANLVGALESGFSSSRRSHACSHWRNISVPTNCWGFSRLRARLLCCCVVRALSKIFRARDKLLMRTLWWDDDESANVSSIQTSMRDASFFEGGGTGNWENVVENAEARRILRRLVREAMALADFFAKDNARGKVRPPPNRCDECNSIRATFTRSRRRDTKRGCSLEVPRFLGNVGLVLDWLYLVERYHNFGTLLDESILFSLLFEGEIHHFACRGHNVFLMSCLFSVHLHYCCLCNSSILSCAWRSRTCESRVLRRIRRWSWNPLPSCFGR